MKYIAQTEFDAIPIKKQVCVFGLKHTNLVYKLRIVKN